MNAAVTVSVAVASVVAAILAVLVALVLLKREHSRRRDSEIWMARLAQGVDQGGVLVTLVNRMGRIEYVNGAVESITGFSSEELMAPRSGRWFP